MTIHNIIDRTIEQIPKLQDQREYRFKVNDREVSVYRDSQNEWRWRTEDCRFYDWRFMAGFRSFDSAADARRDAVLRLIDNEIT